MTAPTDPDLPALNSANPPSYQAMRTPEALYVEYADGSSEHYDIAIDPDELVNLAGGLDDDRRRLFHAPLDALASCRGAAACSAGARASH